MVTRCFGKALGEKVLRQAQHDNSQGLGEDAKSNEKMKAYCFGKLSMTKNKLRVTTISFQHTDSDSNFPSVNLW